MRAFVAVEVPATTDQVPSARIAEHLTLRFLGEIAPSQADALGSALAADLREVRSFPLAVEGVGAFPDPVRPRVVWAGLTQGRDALVALAGRVEAVAVRLGLPKETRPFVPHVTILRVRGPRDLERARHLLDTGATRRFGSTVVREAVLYESELRPDGPLHRPLRRFPFVTEGPTHPPAEGSPP